MSRTPEDITATDSPGHQRVLPPSARIGLMCDIEGCVNGPVLHPWNPTCRSGFDE
jgi:hypothetical protein